MFVFVFEEAMGLALGSDITKNSENQAKREGNSMEERDDSH